MQNVMIQVIDALAKFGLDKLERALIFGVVLAAALAFATGSFEISQVWFAFLFRWLHVLSGVMWIGLLWYFNFVQIPSMPKIPDEQKPAIGKIIAPTALFWFRWAALSTVVTGLILATLNGYIVQALLLGYFNGGPATYIGLGMWLGLIMAYNVWNIIWPNQKKVLGLVEATDDEKKAAARTAMLTSRLNTMFSIPMLYFMVAAGHLA
ncbi:putative membrane protein [Methylocaldum marinum]|uniref:Putative membrane protein n=1 Tax=Methylocaldum marinum TaxID=1432792 RepID=A0A286P367_9GAMM|nr:urate hydroxylase PuuD [Methylocaldum marinum]BBA32089.1 putative membrane protein [Methylocaldum marinum]